MAYTVDEVKKKIATNRQWAGRALLRLHSLQTEREQLYLSTIEDNKVGFNAVDAEFLSSLAEQLKDKGWLSHKQWIYAQRLLPKYARQLLEVGKDSVATTKVSGG